MNIFPGKGNSLRANYDFRIITGAMLLYNDEETLDDPVGDSDDNSGTDDSAESEDKEHTKSGGKRNLKKDTEGKTKCRPAKKKRIMPSLSRRDIYRLRGEETGEGEILSDTEAGEIDFLNDDCTKFSGLSCELPYVGSSIDLDRYKISNAPKGFVKNWNDYSGAAYERARMGRWR
jgi:hypothetical protein